MKQLFAALITLAVTAVLLAVLNAGLAGPAAANAEAERQKTMALLLPGSTTFVREEYSGEDTNILAAYKGETGYVVETATDGYVDTVVLWVAVDNSGAVTGVMVRDMSETFGLGMRAISDPAFLGQFLGTTGDLTVGENVDALTGATVTSKAITKAINSASGFVTGADVSSGATEWGG